MKKKFLALTMVLVLALSFSACGNKTAGSGRLTSESRHLSDWYDSADRKTAENFVNSMLSGQEMKFFMEVEEPDVLVYNYQYTMQLEVTDWIVEQLEVSANSGAEAVIADIQNYRNTYDVELNAIRVVYLNADGSVIYELELTEDYEPSTYDRSYADLQEWIESDDAAQMEEMTNKMIASTGMIVNFAAEGDTFVYEYYLSDETYETMGLGNLSGDQLQSYIESVVEIQRDSLEAVFTSLENTYGITLDAVRVVFYEEDGTFIASSDIENDAY